MIELENFMDEMNRVTRWPARRTLKLKVLEYIVDKFEYDRTYTEMEVNDIINRWHTFNDHSIIRREMITQRLMSRLNDGKAYWREPNTK